MNENRIFLWAKIFIKIKTRDKIKSSQKCPLELKAYILPGKTPLRKLPQGGTIFLGRGGGNFAGGAYFRGAIFLGAFFPGAFFLAPWLPYFLLGIVFFHLPCLIFHCTRHYLKFTLFDLNSLQ